MPTTKAQQVTKDQIRAIRSMASYIYQDDDDYRALLDQFFPTKEWSDADRPSTKDLTRHEAHLLISALGTKKEHQQPWKGRYTGDGKRGYGKRCTQAQADEIARLEYKLGWMSDPRRLVGFIRRQISRRKVVEKLSKREATKVITGLRKLLADESTN